MKTSEGVDIDECFLDIITGWRGVVSFTPRRFIPGKSRGTHCIGGWMDPKAGLDHIGK
jgi:hypothetical protein